MYVSTFPPRECGIATFTQDLTRAIDNLFAPAVESKIVAMNIQRISKYYYSKKVVFQINQSHEEDYIKVAEQINKRENIKLVNIQHEFGIFGGEYGAHLLKFTQSIKKPIVTTFHSVLPTPDPQMREVVRQLSQHSASLIVMTQFSKEILVRDYEIENDKIRVIPHGIHPTMYETTKKAKTKLKLANRLVLSTFGLLSKDKGIEYVLDALPEVVKKFPRVCYLIIGSTHPVVRKQEGEEYRNFLMKKVYNLGLTDNVRFYDKYFEVNDLLEFLQATDVYLSTSLNPNQAVSGTLSYALGTGRPVISTSFAQAKELVTEEIGILIDFKSHEAYKKAILKLLSNEQLITQMGRTAYFRTRNMTWPNVALSYIRTFSHYVSNLSSEEKNLPPVKISHLTRLTNGFGIIQFANLAKPEPPSGYTLDDNARALVALAEYYEKFKKTAVLNLVEIYLNFVQYVSKPNGYFDNYVYNNRAINDTLNQRENLDDANARALQALMHFFTIHAIPSAYRDRAYKMFYPGLKRHFDSPRAAASFVKGLYYILSYKSQTKEPSPEPPLPTSEITRNLEEHCDALLSLYHKHRSENWEWFEDYLTYSNSVLSEALLLGYLITSKKEYFEVGKKTLDFLIHQTFHDDIYIPIGQSGWYKRDGKRFYFDQQPEDTSAMVQSLKVMYSITQDQHYKDLMYKTFYWFLGDNTLRQVVYDNQTGGCYDGVGEKYINLNQGAESTISYLLARLILEKENF